MAEMCEAAQVAMAICLCGVALPVFMICLTYAMVSLLKEK